MDRLYRRIFWVILAAAALYAAAAVYFGLHEITRALARFALWRLGPVLLLSSLNFLLRYLKWHLYLEALGVKVPSGRNAVVFLGGLSMTVTPGKVGELLKAYLLRTAQGVPVALTASVVLAERVTDLLALVLLAAAGSLSLDIGRLLLVLVACGLALFYVVVSSRRLALALIGAVGRLPKGSALAPRLGLLYESTAELFRWRPLLLATLLSTLAWFCECMGLFVVVGGFPTMQLSVSLALFIYAGSTLGGLPTPGGLGLTEGGMGTLLRYLAKLPAATAAAATALIRLCTLWFAVGVGLIALVVFRRKVGLT